MAYLESPESWEILRKVEVSAAVPLCV